MKTTLLTLLCLFVVSTASAQAKKTYAHEKYQNTTRNHEWDFSAMIGLYNPGTGFGARAAYRIVDDILPSANDSLSIEGGLTFVSVSESFVSTNVSYSVIEIPIHARWDFHLANNKFIVAPEAGLNYMTAGTVSVGGVPYTAARGGGVFVQLGVSGIYYFTENLGARAQLLIGSYTTLGIGLNYAL